jgi:hypothetical protein
MIYGVKMGSFFDEYKSLDRLCKDILESENGVTEYIERMEREERGKMIVADWDRDYKKLKSMRYIRNKIAHEDGVSEDDVCSPSDTSWLMEFQDRIMDEEDPLTVLYNYDASQQGSEDNFPDYPDINDKPKKTKSAKGASVSNSNSDQKPNSASRPRKKAEENKNDPAPDTSFFKPHIDFLTALAAILLVIGVAAAIIVSCL